jgi:hypothetical protein
LTHFKHTATSNKLDIDSLSAQSGFGTLFLVPIPHAMKTVIIALAAFLLVSTGSARKPPRPGEESHTAGGGPTISQLEARVEKLQSLVDALTRENELLKQRIAELEKKE